LNQWRFPLLQHKFQTAIPSVLCEMFQAELSYVVNLMNVFLVHLPNFTLNHLLLFWWLQLLHVYWYVSCSTIVASPDVNSCILVSFLLPFAWHFCPLVSVHLSMCVFSVFCF
jgi:hypothetical protein